MYIQLVYILEMRKQKVGEGGESCRDQRVGQWASPMVPSAPLSSPSLQRETHPMDPRESKRANEKPFLFDFKIPATKAEAAALSWCPRSAPSTPEDLPGGLSFQAPGAAQPHVLQWRPQCHSPPQGGCRPARPKREGKVNSTLDATWGCYRCPAGPQEPASLIHRLVLPASP